MADRLKLTIVTPESIAVETPAKFVALPAFDGEVGLLPGHAPMVCRLGFGEVRIEADSGWRSFYIDGGVAQVRGSNATVLTNAAIAPERIDVPRVKADLAEAEGRKAVGDEALAKRMADADRARWKLRVAERHKA